MTKPRIIPIFLIHVIITDQEKTPCGAFGRTVIQTYNNRTQSAHYFDSPGIRVIFQAGHRSNRLETRLNWSWKIKEDIQHIANIIGPVELVKNNHLQLSTKKKLKKNIYEEILEKYSELKRGKKVAHSKWCS